MRSPTARNTRGRVPRSIDWRTERAARFFQLRDTTGLSQEAFANAAGLTRVLVCKLESGANAGASFVVVRAYGRATGIATDVVGAYLEGETHTGIFNPRGTAANAGFVADSAHTWAANGRTFRGLALAWFRRAA